VSESKQRDAEHALETQNAKAAYENLYFANQQYLKQLRSLRHLLVTVTAQRDELGKDLARFRGSACVTGDVGGARAIDDEMEIEVQRTLAQFHEELIESE